MDARRHRGHGLRTPLSWSVTHRVRGFLWGCGTQAVKRAYPAAGDANSLLCCSNDFAHS